jgi:hypothetical protein
MERTFGLLRGLVMGALVLAGGVGCGSLQQDRVDTICECENCGDRDREIAEVEVDGEFEVADTYGCTETLEAYFECQLSEHECEGRRYIDDDEACGRPLREYIECKDAFSAREGGPY